MSSPSPVYKPHIVAPLAPYIAVLIGMYLLRSAWMALLLYQVLMVLILSLEGQWHHARTLLKCQRILLITMALPMILSGVALFSFAPLLGLTTQLAANASRFGLEGGRWMPFIFCFSLTNGWLEELYWRGYLGTPDVRLSRYDVWFGGYHALVLVLFVDGWWALAAAVLLIGAAWLWRQLARLSGGLFVNAVSHIGADLSIMLATWALIRTE